MHGRGDAMGSNMRSWWVLTALIGAAGCVAPASESACAAAVGAVEACYGASLEQAPYSDECTDAEAANALAVMEELDASGCEGEAPANAGKADLFCLSSRWDPLGLCDNPPALGDEPEGQAARYPILLAHGFNTSTTNFWRFHDDS